MSAKSRGNEAKKKFKPRHFIGFDTDYLIFGVELSGLFEPG